MGYVMGGKRVGERHEANKDMKGREEGHNRHRTRGNKREMNYNNRVK
jgi:hypothetical protein